MPTQLKKYIVPTLVFVWLMLIAKLAHAQPVVISQGLASIPPDNLIIAAGLSFVGGLAWTSQKEAKSMLENKKLWVTVFSDLLGSVVCGIITYFGMATVTESVMIQAAAITIAGYGGTAFLDLYVSLAIGKVKDFFSTGGNKA